MIDEHRVYSLHKSCLMLKYMFNLLKTPLDVSLGTEIDIFIHIPNSCKRKFTEVLHRRKEIFIFLPPTCNFKWRIDKSTWLQLT